VKFLPALLLCAATLVCGADSRWQGMEFLFGNWTATGGRFSFQPDLSGQIVVRRNASDAPKHDDLMVIYAEGGVEARHAIYFDNEGHVIRYKIATPAKERVVFESEGEGPRYRLSYWLDGKVLQGKFEVGDRVYLEWSAKRE